MPHLMLEYTDNLHDAFNPRQTLFKLHKSLVSKHFCEPEELKSRAIKLNDYLIGDGSVERGFIHLRFAQRATLPEEDKQRLMEALHEQLCQCIGSPAIPVQITTESIDLQPQTCRYLKTVRQARS